MFTSPSCPILIGKRLCPAEALGVSQAPSSASNQHRFRKMAVGRGRDSTQHPFPEVTYSIFTHTLSILSHMATFKVEKYILSGVGQEEYGKHLENSKYSLPCLQQPFLCFFFSFLFFPPVWSVLFRNMLCRARTVHSTS